MPFLVHSQETRVCSVVGMIRVELCRLVWIKCTNWLSVLVCRRRGFKAPFCKNSICPLFFFLNVLYKCCQAMKQSWRCPIIWSGILCCCVKLHSCNKIPPAVVSVWRANVDKCQIFCCGHFEGSLCHLPNVIPVAIIMAIQLAACELLNVRVMKESKVAFRKANLTPLVFSFVPSTV